MTVYTNTGAGGTPGAEVTAENSGDEAGDAFTYISSAHLLSPEHGACGTYFAVIDGKPAYRSTLEWTGWLPPAEPSVTTGTSYGWEYSGENVAGSADFYGVPFAQETPPLMPDGSNDPDPDHYLGFTVTLLTISMGGLLFEVRILPFGTTGLGGPATQVVCWDGGTYSVLVDGIPLIDGGGGWIRVEFAIKGTNPGHWEFRSYPNQWTTTPSEVYSGPRTWDSPGTGGHVAVGTGIGLWNNLHHAHMEGYYRDFGWTNFTINEAGDLPGPSTDGWTDIDGANATTYCFTAVAADDQSTYRAIFTNDLGTAATRPATLTVTTVGDDAPTPEGPRGDIWAEAGVVDGTVLEQIRRFSAAVRRVVRLTGKTSIEMVPANTPLPAGIVQDDAASMYHSTGRTAAAGTTTLSLEDNALALTATAELGGDDVRLVLSSWRIPDQLPVYGLRPAPVARVTYTFTPADFRGSLDFVFPTPLTIVRRSP